MDNEKTEVTLSVTDMEELRKLLKKYENSGMEFHITVTFGSEDKGGDSHE